MSFAVAAALAQVPAAAEPASPALASPSEARAPQTALSVNTLGPAVSLAVTALGAAALSSETLPFNIWVADLNLRGHHMFTPKLGLTAQVDYTSFNFVSRFTHAGLRVGPRLSLRAEGLTGWALSPYLMGGATFVRAGAAPLSRWGVLGLGADATRTWVRPGGFTLELGFGLYSSVNVGYAAQASPLEGNSAPASLSPVKPRAIVGVGYAF